MTAVGRAIGVPFSKTRGLRVSCSTKRIIESYKARLTAAGVVVGNLKCVSGYVNNLTGTTKAECIVTAYRLRLQALGVVTNSANCLTNYVKRLNGEDVSVLAYCDTMDEAWDTIDYNFDSEWYQPIN